MLNDQQKAVVKATAPILATNGEALLAQFYSRLLTHNPELKQLFNMTHQRTGSQPRALAHAVHAYATYIDDPSVLAGALRHIAMRHCSVGVRAEHYPIIGRHLIAAIREVLGEIATPSVIDAWSAAFPQETASLQAWSRTSSATSRPAPSSTSPRRREASACPRATPRSSSSRRASAPPCSAAWTSTAPSPSKGRAVPSGRPALLSFGHFLGVSLL